MLVEDRHGSPGHVERFDDLPGVGHLEGLPAEDQDELHRLLVSEKSYQFGHRVFRGHREGQGRFEHQVEALGLAEAARRAYVRIVGTHLRTSA